MLKTTRKQKIFPSLILASKLWHQMNQQNYFDYFRGDEKSVSKCYLLLNVHQGGKLKKGKRFIYPFVLNKLST